MSQTKHKQIISKILAKLTMSFSYIVDQLHNKDSFPHTGATEKPDFSTPLIRCKKIHHLLKIGKSD